MINQPDPHTSDYSPGDETVPLAPAASTRSVSGNGAYIESQREQYHNAAGQSVARQVDVYEDKNLRNASIRYWISAVVYFLLGVLEAILGLRFLFRLLGANEGNAFISFLYSLTHVFVGPFNGIFNDQAIGSRSVFELSTLIAMIIYGLIAWGLVSLGHVLFAPRYNGSERVSTTWRG